MAMLLNDAHRYDSLRFIVETTERGGPTRWEAIAAFDAGRVAEKYADDCRESNAGRYYRVVVRELDCRTDESWRVYQATS